MNFFSKLDLRGEITNEFDSDNKFIVVRKTRLPYSVKFNGKFVYVISDFIFQNQGNNIYHMGEANSNETADSVLVNKPVILSKDKIISLFKNDYDIITNPCMELGDAEKYIRLRIFALKK